jgi:branched-chain amino acid transport system ATP-binding protein
VAGDSVLEVAEVSVQFGGVVAVDEVSISAEAGAITGLIGPNGAGKTTLFNVITGLQATSGGVVRLEGTDITSLSPTKRARRGIGRTFQRFEIFGSLSAYDNILTATEFRRRWSDDTSDPQTEAQQLVEKVGLAAVANQRADSLSTGYARLIELARALAIHPRLLLLDEPGSGLDETETEQLAELLQELARDGMAILLVEHDVELVMSLCAVIHVLDQGRLIAAGTAQEIRASPAVQLAYLGE